MKTTGQRLLSFLLAAVLLLSLGMGALAAGTDLTAKLYDANGAELVNNTISVSDQDQTVKMSVTTAAAIDFCGLEFTPSVASGLSVSGVSNEDANITFTAADYNATTYKVGWITADTMDISSDDIGSITVTVPANTPAGTYDITMGAITVVKTFGTVNVITNASVTATLTIEEASEPTSDYTVTISDGVDGTAEVEIGDTVTMYVTVDQAVNGIQATVSYDTDCFSSADDTHSDGVIELEQKLKNDPFTEAYTLTFTAIAAGTGTFRLDSAVVGSYGDFKDGNALEAAKVGDSVTVKGPATYTVTLGSGLTGDDSATEGTNYSASIDGYDADEYDYTVTVTVGGSSYTGFSLSENGVISIPGDDITGDIEISVSAEEKAPATYSVTLGSGLTGAATATEGSDYSASIDGYDADEYNYTVTVTIGGNSYTGFTLSAAGVITIPGSAVTGNIVINVSATEKPADSYNVTLGSGLTGAANATEGTDYSASIDGYDADAYDYTVTVTVGGNSYTGFSLSENGVITIPGDDITGDIVINVSATEKPDYTVEIEEYITGVSLILVTGENASGYTYDGNAMYYVDEYDAFAWLLQGNADQSAVAEAASGTYETISAGYDVNGTGKVDFYDAGAAFGCYNNAYTVADYVAMYLRADVNGDYSVDAADVSAIMDHYSA